MNVVATVTWLFQLTFAFLYHRKARSHTHIALRETPKLSVVVPSYNETAATVQKVVDAINNQQGVEVEVFVVDDGSQIPLVLKPDSRLQMIRLSQNEGKRRAQMHAIEKSSYDWIVTVDSDTILEPDALYNLCQTVSAENLDAATGAVFLRNEKANILTRMTGCLYWFSFFQERAAQAYFGKMTCCAGALSIYRKAIVLSVKDEYLNQSFLGRECIAGDDRFMTCLFALQNKRIGCSLNAIARTISPGQTSTFLRQQIRWTRSHVPAFFYMFKHIGQCPVWFMLFMAKIIFRYVYFLTLISSLMLSALYGSYAIFLMTALFILGMSFAKCVIAWLYTRDLKFLWMLPLGLWAFVIISPVLLYGVFTPLGTNWMTRKKNHFTQSS